MGEGPTMTGAPQRLVAAMVAAYGAEMERLGLDSDPFGVVIAVRHPGAHVTAGRFGGTLDAARWALNDACDGLDDRETAGRRDFGPLTGGLPDGEAPYTEE